MAYFFTSDEHFGHKNIIKYCNRPFSSVEEMDETLIDNFNSKISDDDVTVHLGDFCLYKSVNRVETNYIDRLNGEHIFIMGSHDKWLSNLNPKSIFECQIDNTYIVGCHYLMKIWPLSHYGSWLLFGHSHGASNNLIEGKQHDVGVDNNNYYPLSFNEIKEIMSSKPDNLNLANKIFD